MKKINSLKIINSLAEMTQHYDREIIEKSLLKAIHETIPSKELCLFKVTQNPANNQVDLHLSCYFINEHIANTDTKFHQEQLSESLQTAINDAIECNETQQVISLDDDHDEVTLLYPSTNQEGEVCTLLIQTVEETGIHFDTPRYIYGLLNIHNNYIQLINKSQTDKLTGLLNREALNKQMTTELIEHNSRQKFKNNGGQTQRKIDIQSTWVGVLDIDYFKKINDNFGHLFGDEVLILISSIMTNLLRPYDNVFRFGGEEFVILLQANSSKEANSAFERIRHYIENHNFPKIDTITVSIGVTEIMCQPSISDIIGEADTALYYAKEHGRNQTFMYQALVDEGVIQKNNANIEDDIELF